MQVHRTPVLINADDQTVTVMVGSGGPGVYYGPNYVDLESQSTAAPGSTFTVTSPTYVKTQGGRDESSDISVSTSGSQGSQGSAGSSAASSVAIGSLGALPKGIASRCMVNQQLAGLTGTTTGETLRQDHLCLANCDDLRVAYSNSYGGGRAAAANDIFVRAALEDPAGTVHQVTFNGGLTEVQLHPGVTVFSDPVGIGLANGARFHTRTFVRVANVGELVPQGALTRVSPYSDGAVAGDATMTASPAWATDGNFHFGPAGVFADFTDAAAIIAIVGDSISAGQNDGNANQDLLGWQLRALNNQYPYVHVAIAGDAASAFRPPVVGSGATSRKPRVLLLQGCTAAMCLYGTNDLGSGSTPAVIEDSLLRVYRPLRLRGIVPWAATIPPRTTSTDSWTTLANQTLDANNTNRIAINDWLRAGAPVDPTTRAPVAIGTTGALLAGQPGHSLAGYFETADTVESARNSGKWRVDQGQLSEGTHPNSTGSALMAGAVDTTKLGVKAPGATAPAPIVDPSTIFGANLFARYQAGQITGLADGAAIAQWNDTAGNNRHLVQATGTKQPLYKTAINFGQPAVRFDGVDDFMQTAAFGTLAQPFEVVILAKFRSNSHAAVANFLGGQGGSTFTLRWGAGTAPQQVTAGAGTNLSSAFTSDPFAAWHVWHGVFNGASSAIYEDEGASALASGNAGANSITALAVAADGNGGSLADIDVQEVLIVNRASTSSERAALHSYFVSTYATP